MRKKTVGIVVGVLVLALAGTVYGLRFSDDTTIDQPITKITLHGGSGGVAIRTEPGPVRIRRTVTYLGDKPGATATVRGDVLTLGGCGGGVVFCSIAYAVIVPPGTALSGDIGSGGLAIDGLAEVDVRSGSGDVLIANGTGDVRVDNGPGDVLISLASPQNVTVRTGSGSASLEVPVGSYRLDGKSDSGNRKVGITEDPKAVHRLSVTTGSGDAKIQTR
ncbi:hypothetical protein D5S17_10225 [Pseudonocardiaceae bacterium YIM PH 21723]|nr:hypothetical protein D5S17_10225 [Pseudonocardiaceae bacterium YIM PH 21723]